MTRILYWDSSVFNAWFNREAGRFEICDGLLRDAEQGKVQIVTSAITYLEVYGYPLSAWQNGKLTSAEMEEAETRVRLLFRNEYIEQVAVERFIIERAHDLRRDVPALRRSSIDAIHLACALMTSVDEMHTYDNDNLLRLSPFQG